ncbi:Pyrimidine-nucleoside phosphorylase [Candidatus Syntrophocurvum alkaliphilum]|uniref:Anthranilate phosphoribosyltransferase n=1 Tax=Candidatus Syntrophocurvum alkaliphilum TaxID=2293317 RepID=A0A6I6DGD7_9FIRM|nr:anthranilate phosphoribosyltransferase [Candidatus Syntrophocurvum alkaliphilum]QGT99460.1 Pyrimidine-nucleoside phosphorylase [Candidatus Syntrophocurvum alkaliphilum]
MRNFKEFSMGITKLLNKENLTHQEAKDMFFKVLNNDETEMHQGAFLAALAAKGEAVQEIAAAWEAIYELDTVKVTPNTTKPLVENCGTGMDSVKTFNISTAASIVASTAGVVMAKHGARAITSKCGTIDILEELGIDVECSPELVKKSIEEVGIGIFNGMSPKIHPKALGRILSQISFGSILNISASLANPALPKYAVRGVYSKQLLKPTAIVMREIGYKKALIVHGLAEDGINGMDEASTLNETFISELKEDGSIVSYSFFPEDFGIKRTTREAIQGQTNKSKEAIYLLKVLNGEIMGPRNDIICLNTALILYLMNSSKTINEGYIKAKDIIASGMVIDKLKQWVAKQNNDPQKGLDKLEHLLKLNRGDYYDKTLCYKM